MECREISPPESYMAGTGGALTGPRPLNGTIAALVVLTLLQISSAKSTDLVFLSATQPAPTAPPLVMRAEPGGANVAKLGKTSPLGLGVDSVTVSVPVQPRMRTDLLSVQTLGIPRVDFELQLVDVRTTPGGSEGDYSYAVYLNLPKRRDNVPVTLFYLGQIGRHSGVSPMIRFSLTKNLRAQAESHMLSSQSLEISFIRVGLPKKARVGAPFLTIGSMQVVELKTY